jgi:2-(1,2-epoxy-1,2-dihydrophenyl)acetyl-CoA isomerase
MPITLKIENHIATVTLDRPEKKNALNVEMREQLVETFQKLRFDDDVRAIIVTGAGDSFCSGGDVGKMDEKKDIRGYRENLQRMSHQYMRILHSIEKPVIAAVRGSCVGIGWSIALGSDIIIASETAKFSQRFRKVGLAPDGGAIWFLTRRIGTLRAKELVFSARFVEADEALSLGLVTKVVKDDQLMQAAQDMAADLADAPTFALGLAKKLFNFAEGPSLEDFLELEVLVQPQLRSGFDHQEGVAAFKEKRDPKFRGR